MESPISFQDVHKQPMVWLRKIDEGAERHVAAQTVGYIEVK